MDTMTKPRVSLVLPAYNEAADLRSCLDAIMAQTVAPYEIIVVDNNSTDDTAAIAREYPGVRVLNESRQGVVFARSRGFDAARGDVIGRIDAETIIESNWVETVQRVFAADPALSATSGRMHYYDVALSTVVDACDGYFRRVLAVDLAARDNAFLQGANMALRVSSWRRVKSHVCNRGGMHEDFDLAIHLQDSGMKVTYNDHLRAGISARRTDVGFLSYFNYVRVSPHTYALHGKKRNGRTYWVYFMALLAYLPCRILYRGLDPTTRRFSLRRMLFLNLPARPDPTDI